MQTAEESRSLLGSAATTARRASARSMRAIPAQLPRGERPRLRRHHPADGPPAAGVPRMCATTISASSAMSSSTSIRTRTTCSICWPRCWRAGSENICVVGDDDQSIYRFRGATIENILNFENEYHGRAPHPAGAELPLDAVHSGRGQRRHLPTTTSRKGKNLWTENGQRGPCAHL